MKIFKTFLLALPMLYCMSLSAKPIAGDTLRVVRDDEFLRYPFGVIESFKAFKTQHSTVLNLKSPPVRPYQGGEREQTKTFTFSGSYARFYTDKNTKKLETVNAIILDKEMPLQNGIMIGMERRDILKKMNISGDAANKAHVVELSSKSGDIHHFYHFQNDRLIRITILSKLFYQNE